MKLEYLKQADAILTKCGRPILPGGVTAVPIYKGFLMPMVLAAGGGTAGQRAVMLSKIIQGDTPWVLRAISSDVGSNSLIGVRIQIQFPNGRYLFGGNGIDLGQFCWVGSSRWLQDPELRIEPGGRINVTLVGNATTNQLDRPVNLLFEGAYLYFMKGGQLLPATGDLKNLVSQWPRYQGTPNQNILAPCWRSNEGIRTPPGFSDEYWIYSSPDPQDAGAQATWTISGAVIQSPYPQTIEIPIEPGSDFFVRRMLFDVSGTSLSVGATVYGRIRTGAGYALDQSYIELAGTLSGVEFAAHWKVHGGDSIYIDVFPQNYAGTGTVSIQVHAEGFRRYQVKG